jgi:UDP-glucose 4-epimerase
MRVFVTGGAGFIGSITVERLIAAGKEVVVFDNLSQGHRDAVHPDACFVKGDLADAALVDHALAEYRPDAIMHFASRTLVGESMARPFLYLGENITNGLNLFQAAVARNVKKIIISSTANLFDQVTEMPITETSPIQPGSPYGESKYILERMLHWLDKTQGVHFAALRYFNAAGASAERGEDHDPETHLIPLVLDVAQGKRQSISIFGDDYPTPDGTCVRDYIHVEDLADAHILALGALDQGSRTYNLGSGTGHSVKQVVALAEQISGCDIPVEIGPRRPGDPAVLVAGSERIQRELNWKPNYTKLEEIIASAWRWRLAHPNGYAK